MGGGGVKVPSIDLCSLLQRTRAIRETGGEILLSRSVSIDTTDKSHT